MSSKLRDIILNTHVPLVLRDFPNHWECFQDSLQEWCARYDKASNDSSLPVFEAISIADGATPQWERKRSRVRMTMQQFLEKYATKGVGKEAPTEWAAYQYKRANELPPSCLTGIDFKCFGFAEHQNDYSLWLGSACANTPCHYDTYGVNIVVQAFGCKSWLLFPPETPLQCTRIPYEESSVYCLENFYAPAPHNLRHYEQFQAQAHHCLLQPGDVLIVPRHWWHYVEAAETSLSVNYWVPLKADMDLTLDELLVKHIVESFVKGESDEVKQYLLNPNQLDEIAPSASTLFDQFERAVQQQSSASGRKLWTSDYLSQSKVQQLLDNVEERLCTVDVMSKEAYSQLLESNSKRCDGSSEQQVLNSRLELLINSMCSARCIATIKGEFYRRLGHSET
ncbi:HSPB1-associated protein 1 [Drosophila grimshawi]|uniref:GH16531 n=1 Tax=Drosophila grimshawi TaxID=7222 RepID=B4JU61_DROGR|nr:HSPB1-associated protein 1 [Drosophila grimshawi]EDV91031.1 GH16531 [Drosophila grimshawi]